MAMLLPPSVCGLPEFRGLKAARRGVRSVAVGGGVRRAPHRPCVVCEARETAIDGFIIFRNLTNESVAVEDASQDIISFAGSHNQCTCHHAMANYPLSGYGGKVGGGFRLNFSNLSAVRATPKSGEWMISSSQWPDKLEVFPSERNETQITLPVVSPGNSTRQISWSCILWLCSLSSVGPVMGCHCSKFSSHPRQKKISSKDAPMVLSSDETNFHSS